jgi:hypothetical protein
MTEIEERYEITFLHAKKSGIDEVVVELASVCGKHLYKESGGVLDLLSQAGKTRYGG